MSNNVLVTMTLSCKLHPRIAHDTAIDWRAVRRREVHHAVPHGRAVAIVLSWVTQGRCTGPDVMAMALNYLEETH